MHHPLDVAGGVVVGIGALVVLLFACRAAAIASEARAARTTVPAPTPQRQAVA
jgi:membrane-associated phospholipid phosphatase